MERLVAVGLRMVYPVAEPVGVGFVDLTECHVDIEALAYLFVAVLWREYYAHGKYVVYLIEGDVLVLHLAPDGIWTFHACLYLVVESHGIECGAYGFSELLEESVALLFGEGKLVGDVGVFFRVFEAEAEVFEFGFYLVKSETVGKWCVDVQCFSGDFVLFVSWLRLEGSHIV